MTRYKQLDAIFGADSNDSVISGLERVRQLWAASVQASEQPEFPALARSWTGYAVMFDNLPRATLRLFVRLAETESILRDKLGSAIPLTVQSGVHFGLNSAKRKSPKPKSSSNGDPPPDLKPGDEIEAKSFNSSVAGANVEEGTLGGFLKRSGGPKDEVWILSANHVLALNGFQSQHLITTTDVNQRTIGGAEVDFVRLLDPPKGAGNLADVAVAKLIPGIGWTPWNTASPALALTRKTPDLQTLAAKLMGSKVKSLRGTSGKLAGLLLQEETGTFEDMDIDKAILEGQWLVQDVKDHFAEPGDSGNIAIWESPDGKIRFPLGIMVAVSKNDDGSQGEYTVVTPFETAIEQLNDLLAKKFRKPVDLQLQ